MEKLARSKLIYNEFENEHDPYLWLCKQHKTICIKPVSSTLFKQWFCSIRASPPLSFSLKTLSPCSCEFWLRLKSIKWHCKWKLIQTKGKDKYSGEEKTLENVYILLSFAKITQYFFKIAIDLAMNSKFIQCYNKNLQWKINNYNKTLIFPCELLWEDRKEQWRIFLYL